MQNHHVFQWFLKVSRGSLCTRLECIYCWIDCKAHLGPPDMACTIYDRPMRYAIAVWVRNSKSGEPRTSGGFSVGQISGHIY